MLLSSGQPAQRRLDFGSREARPAETAARGPGTPGVGYVQRADTIAGTRVRVELWAEQRRAGEAACAAVLDELRRFARLRRPGSDLAEGHAADRALALLQRHGVRQARLDVGAVVRLVGEEPASAAVALAV